MEKEAGWTTIDAEPIQESKGAILLNFGGSKQKFRWIPKSCYREVPKGDFRVQQVKTWFIGKNNLWNLVNLKDKPY